MKAYSREAIRGLKKDIKVLKKALRYKRMDRRYEIWKEWFVFENYDGLEITVEFPKFNDKYSYYLKKEIKSKEKELKEEK